jgi:low affinity Fe/Cu permease
VNASAPAKPGPFHAGPPRTAPVVGIRIEAQPRSKAWRLLIAAAAAVALLCVAVVILVQSVVLPDKHSVTKKK